MDRLHKEAMIGNKLISSSQKHICGNFVPHFHDFYEIEYIISGNGSCTINGKQIPCAEGTLFFLTPVDYHGVQTDSAEVFNIMFSELLVDFHHLEPFLRYSAPKAVMIEPQHRLFVERVCSEIVENEHNTAYASALMNCLLLKLAQLYPNAASGNASETLSKILLYVINHYRDRITLDTVAAYAGLVPSYVSSLFKREMQIGFKVYLNSLRLEYARKLLMYTGQSVKQICAECGFEDVPNFIKRFKAYYGMTPTMLRKLRNESKQTQDAK